LSVFLLAIAIILPYSVSAARQTVSTALPDVTSFSLSIQNGNGNVLRGVYIDGLLALPVMQQPSNNAGYVSTIDNTVTQFAMASQFGTVGLLAHNYLSGQYFSQLIPGMIITSIYGDGRTEYFQVTQILRYRATSPYSVYSDFVDLDTQEYLTGNALFAKVYTGSRHVTFQTCITQDGNSSWGRLFIIGQPVQYLSYVTKAD
jgi:hypothetical protein